jgi:hypothetical protein
MPAATAPCDRAPSFWGGDLLGTITTSPLPRTPSPGEDDRDRIGAARDSAVRCLHALARACARPLGIRLGYTPEEDPDNDYDHRALPLALLTLLDAVPTAQAVPAAIAYLQGQGLDVHVPLDYVRCDPIPEASPPVLAP